MKFLHLIALASAALAAPKPVARQDSVVGTVNSALSRLEGSVQPNIDSINAGIDQLKDSVDANAAGELQETIKSGFKGVASELMKTADGIAKITTEAAGGIATAAQNAGQDEVDQLGDALTTANQVVADIKQVLDKASKELTPEVKEAAQAEIAAAKKALGPFVTPLTALADAVKKVVGAGSLDTSTLDKALGQVTKNLQAIADAVGLPDGVNIPGVTKPVM